ncbi:hypothetical protein L2E82_25587 [Cichorium intybus]|uniref:Uncharacterized protein n=1 Tax=Cichorium intybus TaxID=13427 RepID=A0ACB9E426_CICIN|nr:hypothetical protein L2E82_25587 [Cichorium intybus]
MTPHADNPAMTPPSDPTIDAMMNRPILPYVEARLQSVRPVPYELQKARAGAMMYDHRTMEILWFSGIFPYCFNGNGDNLY